MVLAFTKKYAHFYFPIGIAYLELAMVERNVYSAVYICSLMTHRTKNRSCINTIKACVKSTLFLINLLFIFETIHHFLKSLGGQRAPYKRHCYPHPFARISSHGKERGLLQTHHSHHGWSELI